MAKTKTVECEVNGESISQRDSDGVNRCYLKGTPCTNPNTVSDCRVYQERIAPRQAAKNYRIRD